MCVQCVMGAAAGFGVFQAYRFVIKDKARKLLGRQPGPDGGDAALAVDEASTADGPDPGTQRAISGGFSAAHLPAPR
jgi:hypothetical protein